MASSGDRRYDAEADAPTPPVGLPLGAGAGRVDDDASTPPSGIDLSGVITADDYGRAGPAVFGAPEHVERNDDAGDWPKLEYRSRNRPQRPGGGWFRRRGQD
ncbi:hypothetical protein A8924_6164 [Saccharopolyspora erythraea NRRL 2338]|uniref:Uncharacterized protein n=2 Tax=Saccharopolyspora erythraea TaxID=1836 RepID=A4FLT1_SACEN|nr:hypothetical protein [Saccharopolyspora erythraea]EQD88250.1 hypothetical protein N599_00170 [Saccharopolyspora erythraea D]PFG98643.1 hypothetical protein A8924_6164 [Saccharopolyspora erythraea NRRL 2338]QRK88672.1 hypothetical protein JQX30_29170 [Saccharopolyspora erythraea]CAM05006.1 hypothetical protein SACE_5822 [Saccharopolyspora erythraea NRRL 2338]